MSATDEGDAVADEGDAVADEGDAVADLAELVAGWPGERTLAVVSPGGLLGATGDLDAEFELASVTKLFSALTALVAVEEGSIGLDDPAGPPGSTVAHLLAHTSGLAFDGDQTLASPGERRIYSNTGFEVLAAHIESATGITFAEYSYEGVLVPLGLGDVDGSGSPAHGLAMSTRSLLRLAAELLAPTVIASETLAMATGVWFPETGGVLPGFGVHEPNPWGLGFEIRGRKHPHWTGANQAEATFGHFGGAGSYLWVDPGINVAAVSLGSEPFDEWASSAWPSTNAELLRRYS